MPTIDRAFGEKLLTCFDDPFTYGVHLLFNDWWAVAPQEAIDAYAADFERVPHQADFVRAQYFAPPLDLDALKAFAPGTLGNGYYRFIVDYGLEANLATNYAGMHAMLKASGRLDRMPASLQYSVLRGFQLHDVLHVLTGYPATQTGEIALQAFCLAQIRFPYFGMWMSVVTTRMTLLDPDMIVPMMDAISDGWAFGRSAANIKFNRWEDQFGRDLGDIRREYRLDRDPPLKLAA